MAEEFLIEAFRRLKGSRMAEDTLQEAFCRLWARKFSPETLSHAMGMLRVTGRNIEIDEYRRKRKMPTEPISSQTLAGHSAVNQTFGSQPFAELSEVNQAFGSQPFAELSEVSQAFDGQPFGSQLFSNQLFDSHVIESESTDPAVTEAMTKEMMFRKVESLMDSELTELQKRIIRRHDYQGIPLNQIAKELSMQPAAVRMQISRARKTLRKIFIENEEQI